MNSRDRSRREHRGGRISRDRDRDRDRKREDRKREEMRRDPSKSSQDIERDKIRTKKINDSKMLAETQKAIKNLLDSDKVVPPGTEVDIIENEKQMDRDQRMRRSRERHRSWDRFRSSPGRRRSSERIMRISPHHRIRSPFNSLERRRSIDRHRKLSWERRASIERRERRSSMERRRRLEERDQRIIGRRSRSRERRRSRSMERFHRARWSRSPIGRHGDSRHRSYSKSPDRRRKRSPFINEITRQFRNEDLMPTDSMNQGYMHQQPVPRNMQQPQPPMMMNPPLHTSMNAPTQHYIPHPEPLSMHGPSGSSQYMSYDVPQGPPMSFESMAVHSMGPTEYSAGPVLYNQPTNPVSMHQPHSDYAGVPMRSPQPVPAPSVDQPIIYNSQNSLAPMQLSPSSQPDRNQSDMGHHVYSEREVSYNGSSMQRERLKTPEPPVISNTKPFEKTSLSSLLEASVSAKDTSLPVLYPGFKPEILRNCEKALRELKDDDPRLKAQGRFFFDPNKEINYDESSECRSNSILLHRNKNKIIWEEFLEKPTEEVKQPIETHQKYCQTESSIGIHQMTQTYIETADFCVQVCPGELQPQREEKRTIMDRLDGNIGDPYDYGSKSRQIVDLRQSLNNSLQKRSLHRGLSPPPQDRNERNHSLERMPHQDHDSRDFHRHSIRRGDNFSMHRGSSHRSYSPEEFSSDYRHKLDHQDNYHESRHDRSRERSPIMIDNSHDDVTIMNEDSFSRDSGWRGRGKSFGSFNSTHKSRPNRGKHSGGRSFRGGRGGNYRGRS
ncbi:serine/arginine repetitive matrix protein 2-like isoform X2 [Chelonus insularis]|uniref:serine/arginine repetitive matrix protein 2-like isoform X2 n=1 Tax=Chelonus insularis TaxID=460826 RepID=UPI00158F11C9|nr:serine/arginine repetitive matrix protein 2-like isoform X2 [Chelonus insularis]